MRGQDGQSEIEPPNHSASLGDSITSSTRIRFSVHTTAQTESPLATISATIRALSSSLHFRRRPAPVKTSSRRTGSVIALRTVSILSPTVKTKPQTRRSAHHPEGGRKTPLTEFQ